MLPVKRTMPFAVIAAVPFVTVLVAAAVLDLRGRRLPNWLTVGSTLAAFVIAATTAGMAGLGTAALGALLGFAVGFGFFLTGIFGGGDGKYLMALGAFLGPGNLLWAMPIMAIVGGALALAESARAGHAYVSGWRALRGLQHLLTLGHAGELPSREPGALRTVPFGVAMSVGAAIAWAMRGGA